MTHTRWHVLADSRALIDDARLRVLAAATNATRQRGQFLIVLSGGTTPRGLYESLRTADADWSRWHVYFGDERCVATDDGERNSAMARAAWLDHVPIPAAQIHAIPGELGAPRAAAAYARVLADVGDFDVVLLGLGEDGHTASLFPGSGWGVPADSPDTLAVIGAPKPPPERVSLSASRLRRAQHVFFLLSGAGKCDAVRRWRAGEIIPASAVMPANGVDVLLDAAADGASV